MLNPIDNWYAQQEEPGRSCLQFMRAHILKQDKDLTETWKYGMPMFCYKEKMYCYLWVHKKIGKPYLGLVEGKRFDHPALLLEKRARMKILLLDPHKDLPIKTINLLLRQMLAFYK